MYSSLTNPKTATDRIPSVTPERTVLQRLQHQDRWFPQAGSPAMILTRDLVHPLWAQYPTVIGTGAVGETFRESAVATITWVTSERVNSSAMQGDEMVSLPKFELLNRTNGASAGGKYTIGAPSSYTGKFLVQPPVRQAACDPPYAWVPVHASAFIGLTTSASITTGSVTIDITLECCTDDQNDAREIVIATSVGTSYSGMGLLEVHNQFAAGATNEYFGCWVRPRTATVRSQGSVVTNFAGQAPFINCCVAYTNDITTTFAPSTDAAVMGTLGAATGLRNPCPLLPMVSIPAYLGGAGATEGASAAAGPSAVFNHARMVGIRLSLMNTTKVLNREGQFQVSRYQSGLYGLSYIPSLLGLNARDKVIIPMDQGLTTTVAPGSDSHNFSDYSGTHMNTSGNTVGYTSTICQPGLWTHAIRAQDPDGGTSLSIQLDMAFEFVNTSVLFSSDFPTCGLDSYRQAIMRMLRSPPAQPYQRQVTLQQLERPAPKPRVNNKGQQQQPAKQKPQPSKPKPKAPAAQPKKGK